MGRHDYGRLGLGEGCTEKREPTRIASLSNIESIDSGTAVSFCVSKDGMSMFMAELVIVSS